jgi:Transport and Golgi organisation 2
MCTLTVVTGNDTYVMAMNRDEKIARGAGLPPEIHEFDGTRAIYPSDGDGGTWLATNEYGIALALLNWNDIAPRGRAAKRRSRGLVIPKLIDSRSLSDLHEVFSVSNFAGMMPFRLVAAFPSEQEIWEWRWDSVQLDFHVHAWESRHWFSSRLSDEQAESLRGAACRSARHESDAGSVRWLRRLQASHAGGPGPFSLCVHREDLKTLSYTEVMLSSRSVRMCHFRGSPCTMTPSDPTEIEIERRRPAHPNLIVREVGRSPFESCLSH